MGLKFPLAIKDSVPEIAAFCDSAEPLLRERAVNTLGRIVRGCYSSVEPYWADLFRFALEGEEMVGPEREMDRFGERKLHAEVWIDKEKGLLVHHGVRLGRPVAIGAGENKQCGGFAAPDA